MANRNGWGAIRKLPSKRFQASYVGPDGERHIAPDTFKTRTEASEFLARKRVEIANGTWNKASEPSISSAVTTTTEMFEEFALRHISLQTSRSGELLRASTQELYKGLLYRHLKPFLKKEVRSIVASDVQQWYASAIVSGKKTTVSKAYKLLSAVLRRAQSDGILPGNPCSVKGAHNATSGKTVDIPSADEVIRIASAIGGNYSLFVLLAAYGGFRFSELTELRRKDVSTIEEKHGVIYRFAVRRGVTKVKEKFIVSKPKSAMSIRDVPVSASLTSLISTHLLEVVSPGDESLLFPGSDGAHLPHHVFIKAFNKAKENAGVTRAGLTPHSLRHFAGTYLHMAGATLPELMAWLGDSSIAAVQRYLHTTDRTAEIASRMEFSPNFLEEMNSTFNDSSKVV
jgi:integrase